MANKVHNIVGRGIIKISATESGTFTLSSLAAVGNETVHSVALDGIHFCGNWKILADDVLMFDLVGQGDWEEIYLGDFAFNKIELQKTSNGSILMTMVKNSTLS